MSRSRLAQHSGYLERLISMIQPRFYVSTDAADSATARRFQKHIAKPRAEEKHQHKITARERKRARLDPAQPTSLDKQREISASEATTRGDLVDGSEEDEGSDTGDAHIGGVGDDAKGGVLSGIAAPSASSVAELRERDQRPLPEHSRRHAAIVVLEQLLLLGLGLGAAATAADCTHSKRLGRQGNTPVLTLRV